MTKYSNPYRGKATRTFWMPSVAQKHFADIQDLWDPFTLKKEDKVATAGSCFAQHIGRNLQARGANFMDMEPAPDFIIEEATQRKFGYGVFSCRYGNIYTTRQLIQLFDEAFGNRSPKEIVWTKNDRFFDALRPGVNSVGHDSSDAVLKMRAKHLESVRKMFEELDLFVFTLGLTEGWEAVEDGTMYPMAPGTACGTYDPKKYSFHNLRYSEIYSDLKIFREQLKAVNPGARILLTVSPVPLMATASENHVLVASSYSKSVLRAVAGDMAADFEDVFYFPSYEIIISHPFRGSFYEPDLREVNLFGVNLVMDHFFTGPLAKEFSTSTIVEEEFDLICDEKLLDNERL